MICMGKPYRSSDSRPSFHPAAPGGCSDSSTVAKGVLVAGEEDACMVRERQILACSGVLYPPEGFPAERVGAQIWQALRLADVQKPRVCLIATATGDSRVSIDRWYERADFFGAGEMSHLELFVRPNVADVRAHLLAQDVIFVSGGSVVNLLAVWRAHRLDAVLRDCWEAGWCWPGRVQAACAGTWAG